MKLKDEPLLIPSQHTMETRFGKRNWDLGQCGYTKPELPPSSSCERVLILVPRAHYHIRVESEPESVIMTDFTLRAGSQPESLVLKPEPRSAEFNEGRLGQKSTAVDKRISVSECIIGVISYFD